MALAAGPRRHLHHGGVGVVEQAEQADRPVAGPGGATSTARRRTPTAGSAERGGQLGGVELAEAGERPQRGGAHRGLGVGQQGPRRGAVAVVAGDGRGPSPGSVHRGAGSGSGAHQVSRRWQHARVRTAEATSRLITGCDGRLVLGHGWCLPARIAAEFRGRLSPLWTQTTRPYPTPPGPTGPGRPRPGLDAGRPKPARTPATRRSRRAPVAGISRAGGSSSAATVLVLTVAVVAASLIKVPYYLLSPGSVRAHRGPHPASPGPRPTRRRARSASRR